MSDLRIETLEKPKKNLDEKFPCPFEKFANEQGFSLDKGDYMVVPKGFNIPERKGVVASAFVGDDIYFVKGINRFPPSIFEGWGGGKRP